MPIEIAFSATDSYVDYLGTTIFSIITQHPQEELRFYVLSSWLSEHSRRKLARLETERVRIEVLTVDQSQFSHLPIKPNISLETYYRLLLPELLPDHSRVLYLDCDILVTGSLLPLWETDVTDYYAAGVNERDMLYRNLDYRRSIGFTDDEVYINAGVCLLHLDKLRADGMDKRLFEQAEALKDKITHQDQDILNITLKGAIKPLPAIYNYTSYEREVAEIALQDAVIIHYNWHKPWVNSHHVLQYNYLAFERYHQVHRAYRRQVEPLISLVVCLLDTRPEAVQTCLDSILSQTYHHLEVVLVAPFGEIAELAETYVLRDGRCRLELVTSNQPVAAYQAGLAVTHGDYLILVDGEEWLDGNYVSQLYDQLVGTASDVCVSSFSLFNDETGIYSLFETELKAGRVNHSQETLELVLGLKWYELYRHLSLTGKIYRREVFELAQLLMPMSHAPYWALLLLVVAKQISYGAERSYIKRLARVECPLKLTSAQIHQALGELRVLLGYFAQKNDDLTHSQTYYLSQLRTFYERADALGDDGLCRQLEASLNAERVLKGLAT